MAIANLYPAIRPSLNLDFANTKQLDPRITFSRASSATYYGTQTAKAEENLVLDSQVILSGSFWNTDTVVVTQNDTTAPDGTTTAEKIAQTNTTAVHRFIPVSVSFVSGLSYTSSIFIKNGDIGFFQIVFPSAQFGANAYANFDVSTGVTGTVGASATASITSAGGGWYRCVVTSTCTTSGSGSLNFTLITSGTDARNPSTSGTSKFLYAWGAQLEQRSAPTAYTATTTQPITNYIPVLQTASANVARFDHDPVTGESLGLLVEEQRTNLLTYSEDFANAAWTKTRSSIVSNTIVAPDGTLTADKLVEDTTASTTHFTFQDVTVVAGSTNTFSVYVKAAEKTFVQVGVINPVSPFQAFRIGVNLSTGVAGSILQENGASGGTFSVVSSGNGWYRISITCAFPTITSVRPIIFSAVGTGLVDYIYTGNGYSGIYIWGAQLESGQFSTSYVKTEASQVTRSADSASMTGSNFTSWYRADEGTLLSISSVPAFSASSVLQAVPFSISSGASANSIRIRGFSQGNGTFAWDALVRTNDTTQVDTAEVTFSTLNVAVTNAFAYKTNDFAGSVNGAAVSTDTDGILPVVNQANIGSIGTSDVRAQHIRKIAYYSARLTNAQLIALTS